MTEEKTIPFPPFLVRAVYDWCAMNNITPKIRVLINDGLVGIPDHFRDMADLLEFDLSEKFTEDLVINNEYISFTTEFESGPGKVKINFGSVCGVFGEDTNISFAFVETPKRDKPKTSNRPLLKRIK